MDVTADPTVGKQAASLAGPREEGGSRVGRVALHNKGLNFFF